MKIIHCADLHLNSRLTGLNHNKAITRRHELMDTLRIVFVSFTSRVCYEIDLDVSDADSRTTLLKIAEEALCGNKEKTARFAEKNARRTEAVRGDGLDV